jgi:hypothetical protein
MMEIDSVPLSQTSLVRTNNILILQGHSLSETFMYGSESELILRSSGGIICFAVEPKTQNIFLLLGREARFHDVNSSRGVWCAFTGSPEVGETAEETSAREFTEESMACIDIGRNKKWKAQEYQGMVLSMLNNADYFMKINVSMSGITDAQTVRTYFVKEIPWQPHLSNDFRKTRTELLEIRENPVVKKCPFRMRHHPAIRVSTHRVFVNPHFLEKQCIDWWSLDRLQDVLKSRGRYKLQRFRKTFLPVLDILISELQALYQ